MRLVMVAVLVVSAAAFARPPRAAMKAVVVAAEPKVSVQAEIVFASTKPGAIDPSLKKMADTLGAKVKYATLKKLETKTLELEAKAVTLALPNAKTAELSLQALEANVATVKVKLPPTDTTYKLARDKSLYLQAGSHDDGDLWLVLSQPK